MAFNMDEMIKQFAGLGLESGLQSGGQGQARVYLQPAHPTIASNFDKDRLALGFYPGSYLDPSDTAMYGAVGYPRRLPETQLTANAGQALSRPLVELPRHEPNNPLPRIGETAVGYTRLAGVIYSAIGRVIKVTQHPEPVVWVQPMTENQDHTILPYEAPQLKKCTSYLSWNWNTGPNKLKPLPNLGDLADGLWKSPAGGLFVGNGRVVKVDNGPLRMIFVEPA
ncbi:hypothetical protein ASPCAL13970 [Aspergillus calidoustus]|uniref:Uncharacterized protein n=1 Tax=Aspergillus calidoustus TaxID=454130 RepID=A0A0U5GJ62_ASPCI|nr:hypothetical protein ASPCAL13970 [Aspergillus calidoustus]